MFHTFNSRMEDLDETQAQPHLPQPTLCPLPSKHKRKRTTLTRSRLRALSTKFEQMHLDRCSELNQEMSASNDKGTEQSLSGTLVHISVVPVEHSTVNCKIANDIVQQSIEADGCQILNCEPVFDDQEESIIGYVMVAQVTNKMMERLNELSTMYMLPVTLTYLHS